jgi:hypothetical protein
MRRITAVLTATLAVALAAPATAGAQISQGCWNDGDTGRRSKSLSSIGAHSTNFQYRFVYRIHRYNCGRRWGMYVNLWLNAPGQGVRVSGVARLSKSHGGTPYKRFFYWNTSNPSGWQGRQWVSGNNRVEGHPEKFVAHGQNIWWNDDGGQSVANWRFPDPGHGYWPIRWPRRP